MNCRDVRRALPALIDHQLPARQAAAVRQHLAECPECARIYQEYRQDAQLLQTFVRSAPYRSVAREVQLRTRGKRPMRGGWATVAQGGYRLASGLALMALVVLITVSALALRHMAQSDGSSSPVATMSMAAAIETATIATDQAGGPTALSLDASASSWVMESLASSNLVFTIGRTIEADGQLVRLARLGVDRDATYLEYDFPDGSPVPLKIELADDLGNQLQMDAETSGPSEDHRYWAQFSGLDPDANEVTVQFEDASGAIVENVQVPVDLTALQYLPAPYQFTGTAVRTAGISVEIVSIRPGYAVTEIELLATADDPSGVRLSDRLIPETATTLPISITLDGQPLTLLGFQVEPDRDVIPRPSGAQSTDRWEIHAQVLGRVERGPLRTILEYLEIDQSRPGSQYAVGPWVVTAEISEPSRPGPTLTPVAVEPTPAPTNVVTTPTPAQVTTPPPDSQSAQELPRDVYFLADNGNGNVGLWIQSADRTAAHLIINPTANIVDFTLIPESDLIAYRLEGEQSPVRLARYDGQEIGLALTPDGQQVSVYAVSPDGTQTAYVSLDRATLWIADPFEVVYQVAMPEIESIRDVTWSPDGQHLVLNTSRVAQGGDSPPMVIDTRGQIIWQASRPVLEIIWSPDSQNLLYTVYGGIYRVDLADKAEVEITPPEVKDGAADRLFDHLAWLPDGRIGFTRHTDTTVFSPAELWLMNRKGANAWRPQTDLGVVLDLAWTATSSGYGFVTGQAETESANVSNPSEIRFYPDVDQKPIRLATEITSSGILHVEWR